MERREEDRKEDTMREKVGFVKKLCEEVRGAELNAERKVKM